MIRLLPMLMLALAFVAPPALAEKPWAPAFTLADAAGSDINWMRHQHKLL